MSNNTVYTTLCIISIDKNKNDENDESVSFTPFWQDHKWMCNVQHIIPKDKSHSEKNTTYKSVYEMTNVYEYFRSLLNLIIADEEPSKYYQFDIPGIPSILVSHSQIKNITSTILDHIFAICRRDSNWPTYNKEKKITYPQITGEVKVEKSLRNTHYIFNENGDPTRIH